jgi:shikimate kinase
LPTIPQYGWKISSEIPIGYGLKSSSALACAAIKSLNSALWTKLNDEEIVNLAVEAQRRAGCTITGSVDDSWGSITKGWKLIDSTRKISDSILIEGEIEDKLCVLIGIRGSRSSKISTESFSQYHELFERSLTSLKKGDIFAAMTTNGVAVAAASEDDEALRICNSAIIKGAISAGISGSGPAISIICHESEISDISELLMDNGMAVIETSLPHSTERSVPI